MHADAVIGWAWSVFNDYNFDENPLGFRHRTVRALAGTSRRIRHLGLADSLGVDYHKTGLRPHLQRRSPSRRTRLRRLTRREEKRPTSSSRAFVTLANYARDDARRRRPPGSPGEPPVRQARAAGAARPPGDDGGGVEGSLEGHAATTVMNGNNFGPVTLFRVYPDGVDTFSMPAQERTDPSCRETLLKHNEPQPAHLRS